MKSGRIFSCRPIHDYRRHERNVPRNDHFLTNHEFPSNLRIQQMRQSLSRQSIYQIILNPQSVLHHVICTTDIPGELTRYRSLSQCNAQQAIPHRYSRACQAQHTGRCKRTTRLAHLRRFCSSTYQNCTAALCGRRYRYRFGQYHLRTGLNNNRFVPFTFPMGSIQKEQGCSENAYSYRSSWINSGIYSYNRWKSPRRKHTGHSSYS